LNQLQLLLSFSMLQIRIQAAEKTKTVFNLFNKIRKDRGDPKLKSRVSEFRLRIPYHFLMLICDGQFLSIQLSKVLMLDS
jgi:hypothetical protein